MTAEKPPGTPAYPFQIFAIRDDGDGRTSFHPIDPMTGYRLKASAQDAIDALPNSAGHKLDRTKWVEGMRIADDPQ